METGRCGGTEANSRAAGARREGEKSGRSLAAVSELSGVAQSGLPRGIGFAEDASPVDRWTLAEAGSVGPRLPASVPTMSC